ncbi:phosphotransferase family protein [Aquabacterium sp.]|uniref:phosphotransferase family protein n=1 Tax=Aquabacterium sp. TaxID=1872578 RepID=UPI0025C3E237|nr:phosphotransferase family protein [Aquabacterium sp.]
MSDNTNNKGIEDQGGRVRAGEELNVAGVDAWLKGHVPSLQGQPEITQFSGGASNWTYRLKYASGEHGGDFILRRPPAGTKAKGAHDMGREYRVQKALKPVYPVVPTMIGLCEDEAVTGSEFYVMERIAGIIPRKNMPRGLSLDQRTTRQLCTNVLDKLVELHQVDVQATGLDSLGKGSGYCKRQIEGWSDRYTKAKTWNVPSYSYVMAWLKERTPQDVANVVIHNDWRFDNVILAEQDPTKVIGVLDWEMATLGDPLMDLGNALAYWIQADDNKLMMATRRQPTHLPGMLTREEAVDYYLDKSGYKLDRQRDWVFYEVYGLFRLAVIAQQIYYRYHHKQTRNPAFKNFWIIVNYLDWRCKGLIKQARR